MQIPDPIELMERNIDRLLDHYVDEHTCMQCGGYAETLLCMNPTGDGPAVCETCAGLTPNANLDGT